MVGGRTYQSMGQIPYHIYTELANEQTRGSARSHDIDVREGWNAAKNEDETEKVQKEVNRKNSAEQASAGEQTEGLPSGVIKRRSDDVEGEPGQAEKQPFVLVPDHDELAKRIEELERSLRDSKQKAAQMKRDQQLAREASRNKLKAAQAEVAEAKVAEAAALKRATAAEAESKETKEAQLDAEVAAQLAKAEQAEEAREARKNVTPGDTTSDQDDGSSDSENEDDEGSMGGSALHGLVKAVTKIANRMGPNSSKQEKNLAGEWKSLKAVERSRRRHKR